MRFLWTYRPIYTIDFVICILHFSPRFDMMMMMHNVWQHVAHTVTRARLLVLVAAMTIAVTLASDSTTKMSANVCHVAMHFIYYFRDFLCLTPGSVAGGIVFAFCSRVYASVRTF